MLTPVNSLQVNAMTEISGTIPFAVFLRLTQELTNS